MASLLGRYSDGFSSFPLIVINQKGRKQTDKRELMVLGQEDILSFLNKLMIHSISGNCSPLVAKVFCLSDYHNDPTQKFVRANIINEICHLKNCRNIIFLLEGQNWGEEASAEAREALIGTDLIHAKFSAYGWDNMDLLVRGVNLIREVHRLVNRQKVLREKVLISSTSKKMRLEDKLRGIGEKIDILFSEIFKIAMERNQSLYNAVNFIVDRCPDIDIYLIAGRRHFDYIPIALKKVLHCVINLKRTAIKNWEEWDKSMQDMYYPRTVVPYRSVII